MHNREALKRMANRCSIGMTSYRAMPRIYSSTDGLYVESSDTYARMLVCNRNRGEQRWWVMMSGDGE